MLRTVSVYSPIKCLRGKKCDCNENSLFTFLEKEKETMMRQERADVSEANSEVSHEL